MGKWAIGLGWIAFAAIWAVCVTGGLKALESYSQAAGEPARISQDVTVGRKAELLIFLHPLCPCSEATLEELDGLLASSPNAPKCTAYFVQPKNPTAEWTDSALIKRARAIPHLNVQLDPEGKVCKRLGIATSGQILYFGTNGRLAFEGGITPSRGHQGDNAGRRLLESLFRGETPKRLASTPVFGCSLGDLGAGGESSNE